MQRFEAYEDDNGEWRWRLWTADFELVASSGEAFASQAEALGAAAGVRGAAADATIESAPGLGMKAARRLRALLRGEAGIHGAEGGAPGLAERPSPAARRVSPAARHMTLSINGRLPTATSSGLNAGTSRSRSFLGNSVARTTTRG